MKTQEDNNAETGKKKKKSTGEMNFRISWYLNFKNWPENRGKFKFLFNCLSTMLTENGMSKKNERKN